MLKKPLAFITYLLILVMLGLGVRHFAINPQEDTSSGLLTDSHLADISSDPFFSARMKTPQGVEQGMQQYQGKILVVNFWATWCPPCREEMPELSQFQTAYQQKNVVVIGIAEDEPAPVKEYLEGAPVTYPVYVAENANMNLGTTLGNSKGVLPYTVIIKEDGSILKTFYGRINKTLLEKSLQMLWEK